jgi:galactokinase
VRAAGDPAHPLEHRPHGLEDERQQPEQGPEQRHRTERQGAQHPGQETGGAGQSPDETLVQRAHERIVRAAMSTGEAGDEPACARAASQTVPPVSTDLIAFAPGRANLIGEHTDYNAGLALPFAVRDGVTVRARRLPGSRIEAVAEDLGEEDAFELSDPEPAPGWRAFVRGAAGELQRAGVALAGTRLHISGTVPRGSGLSSSAALEVALALALCAAAGSEAPERLELAQLCSRVENDWVGAQTGLLDQIASLYGEERRALLIDFRSLTVDPAALELGEHRLITLDSGQNHTHAGSGYNDRRAECRKASELLGLESLREATLDQVAGLPAPLDRRARHIVTDNQRVRETVDALGRGDLAAVGELLDAAHASLRDDFEISTPAVEDAVRRCKEAGALGARIMGGGFGGNVIALLPPGTEAPRGSLEVRPGPGARLLEEDPG